MNEATTVLKQGLLSLAIFFPLAFTGHLIAKKSRFFAWDEENTPAHVRPRHILFFFAIYFFFTQVVVAGVMNLFYSDLNNQLAQIQAVPKVFLMLAVLLIGISVCSPNLRKIWNWRYRNLSKGFKLGVMALALAFPAAQVASALSSVLLALFDIVPQENQLAVDFVKTARELGSKTDFFWIVLLVTIFAPITEEILFRGMVQTWLRKAIGPWPSIFATALIFACFHFSDSQEWSNISIITTISALAVYLGWLYEKEGSLLSSIALHMSFNAMSLLG